MKNHVEKIWNGEAILEEWKSGIIKPIFKKGDMEKKKKKEWKKFMEKFGQLGWEWNRKMEEEDCEEVMEKN